MHNPQLVVALGVWFFVVHVGHLIAMATLKEQCDARFEIPCTATDNEKDAIQVRKREHDEIVTERRFAGIIAYIFALVFVVVYAVTDSARYYRSSYWATISVLLWGGSLAVYKMIPKSVQYDPTTADQLYREAAQRLSSDVYIAAFVLTLVAFGVAHRFMVKDSPSKGATKG